MAKKKYTILCSWAYYMTFEADDENDAIQQATNWAAELTNKEAADILRQSNFDCTEIEIED